MNESGQREYACRASGARRPAWARGMAESGQRGRAPRLPPRFRNPPRGAAGPQAGSAPGVDFRWFGTVTVMAILAINSGVNSARADAMPTP